MEGYRNGDKQKAHRGSGQNAVPKKHGVLGENALVYVQRFFRNHFYHGGQSRANNYPIDQHSSKSVPIMVPLAERYEYQTL